MWLDAQRHEASREELLLFQQDGLPITDFTFALPQQCYQQLRINLERLRRLSAQRAEHLLPTNVAASSIRLYRGDEVIWRTRTELTYVAPDSPDGIKTQSG